MHVAKVMMHTGMHVKLLVKLSVAGIQIASFGSQITLLN